MTAERDIKKHIQERFTSFDDDVNELSGVLGNISGAEHLHGLSHHTAEGFGIASMVFATMNAFMSFYDFVRGKEVRLPQVSRLGYFSIILTLLMLGFLLPGVALSMGIAVASLGFIFSTTQMVKGAFNYFFLPALLKDDERRLADLERVFQETESQADMNKIAEELERLKYRMALHLVEDRHLKNHPIFVRASSTLAASLALASAILLLFNPAVAAILALISASIGGVVLGHRIYVFLKGQYDDSHAKKTTTPQATASSHQASLEPEESETETDREAPSSDALVQRALGGPHINAESQEEKAPEESAATLSNSSSSKKPDPTTLAQDHPRCEPPSR